MTAAPEIRRVDPFHPSDVDAWWEAYASARHADMGENALVWTREECRTELQQQSATTERRAYLALVDGAVVGSGSLALSLKDNLHSAALAATVPTGFRRQGIGSALLAHCEAEARAAGRTTFHSETTWPASAPVDGAGQPGREFARRHGYAIALGDLQSRLTLPVPDAELTALLAEAPAAGYALRSWIGPVPAEYAAEWAALDAALDTEAPTGDLDIETPSADVDDLRSDEATQAAQGRTSFATIALAPDGRIAAYTQLLQSLDGNAYQWGTLVRREDRGHRLGLRIKLENLRMLQREAPEILHVHTNNAESNQHMLAVNTRLGFVPTARLAELQKKA